LNYLFRLAILIPRLILLISIDNEWFDIESGEIWLISYFYDSNLGTRILGLIIWLNYSLFFVLEVFDLSIFWSIKEEPLLSELFLI